MITEERLDYMNCKELINCKKLCDVVTKCDECPIQKAFNRLIELENKLKNGTLVERSLDWRISDD